MQAIRQHELGSPDVLLHEELPDLQPDECQVRVAVRVAGVHLVDTYVRRGEVHQPTVLPMIPGREVAGVVDAIGPAVDRGWLGARVVTHLGSAGGGYATQAVTPADRLHRLSDALSFEAAVAAVGTGRTAVGVLQHVDLSGDDVVIVTAASGGLGSVLVRAARHAGAMVVALAGGPVKTALVRADGAQIAVDYREDGWDETVRAVIGGDRATVVLDGVGDEPSLRAYSLLAEGGVLINYTGADPAAYVRPGRRMVSPLGPTWTDSYPGGLRGAEEEALARAADGFGVPVVGAPFRLSDAAGAHRALEARTTYGKVVLVPDALW